MYLLEKLHICYQSDVDYLHLSVVFFLGNNSTLSKEAGTSRDHHETSQHWLGCSQFPLPHGALHDFREKQSNILRSNMADIFVSNLFSSICVWRTNYHWSQWYKEIFSEEIPVDLIILKFNFSYDYKAGKQLCFKLMLKKRPLEFKGWFYLPCVWNVSSSCRIPIYYLK